MLPLFLAAAESASMIKLTERHLIQLTLKPGDRRDFAFPVKNSAVIFRGSFGFRALLGTGSGRVHQIGTIEERSPIIGGFFGPNLGKVRILAQEKCSVVFYALIPPDDNCSHFFISGTNAPFEIGSGASSNVTDEPGRAQCLWHIAPDNCTYMIESEGVKVSDRFESWALNRDRTTILGLGRIESRGGIDFFYYRGVDNERKRIRWIIEGEQAVDLPPMSVAIAAGSRAIALGPHGSQVAKLERGNEFAVDFSFTTMFLLVLTIGMLFIMIALIVILTIARCTTKSAEKLRQRARVGEAEEKLLSESSEWPAAPVIAIGGYNPDLKGIPVVLSEGPRFQQT
jgi:hypothetical protein